MVYIKNANLKDCLFCLNTVYSTYEVVGDDLLLGFETLTKTKIAESILEQKGIDYDVD